MLKVLKILKGGNNMKMPSAEAKLPDVKHKFIDKEPYLSDVWATADEQLLLLGPRNCGWGSMVVVVT